MLPSVQNFSMIIMDILIHISNFLEKKMETHHRLTFKKMLHSIFINKDFSQRGYLESEISIKSSKSNTTVEIFTNPTI